MKKLFVEQTYSSKSFAFASKTTEVEEIKKRNPAKIKWKIMMIKKWLVFAFYE